MHSVITESEAKQSRVNWVIGPTKQRDYWSVADIVAIERRKEIECLQTQLDDLTQPGWRFLFAMDETSEIAMRECADMERSHMLEHREEIERIKSRIAELG